MPYPTPLLAMAGRRIGELTMVQGKSLGEHG
jgi:hypothetical protein